MAIRVQLSCRVDWVPDGSGPEFVPSAQTLNIGGFAVISAGGNAPTASNLAAAVSSASTLVSTTLTNTLNLGIVQGWASGNP